MRVELVVTGAVLAVLAGGVPPAIAQQVVKAKLRYPVKFVCGVFGPAGGRDVRQPLTIGRYHTAINDVHNTVVGYDCHLRQERHGRDEMRPRVLVAVDCAELNRP